MQSILMFAQSSAVDLLGVTIVTGDRWVKEETAHTLRALEIAGRSDIPVFAGAEYPLLNSKEESEFWENQFGALSFKGAFSAEHQHLPDVIPGLPEGNPSIRARDEPAIDFTIRMVHCYPGEVTLWAGGPLTNIDHGAGYGQTLFVEPGTRVPAWWTLATVQFDLNTDKFYRQYVQPMTSPIGSGAAVSLHGCFIPGREMHSGGGRARSESR